MKTKYLVTTLPILLLGSFAMQAGTIKADFEDIDNYRDFSVYGLSEEKTLSIFKAELEDELENLSEKYLAGDETLTITFTDIDMAGDIQPWRNTNNADIRYVESIYPPRLEFRYTLTDADGKVLDEGQASISDLAFQMNTSAVIKGRYESFFYEMELLRDWMRKTFRDRKSHSDGK